MKWEKGKCRKCGKETEISRDKDWWHQGYCGECIGEVMR